MEGGGSFRISSSSICRNSEAAEIFSNSFHQEDDEEALKWAAIQNLPTFERLRKGLLSSLQGGAIEIDIEKLGLQVRKDLLERLVRLAEEDNEKFLLKLKDRMDRFKLKKNCSSGDVKRVLLKYTDFFAYHSFLVHWMKSELELIFLP